MREGGKGRAAALAGIGAVVILLVWTIMATLPREGKENREGEVTLRSEIRENFTLKDMLSNMEKETDAGRAPSVNIAESYGPDLSGDTVSSENEIRRIRDLIRENERELEAGIIRTAGGTSPSMGKVKETGEEPAPGEKNPAVPDSVPADAPAAEETVRRGFNSVRLVRKDEKNVVRAFVHSTQTVMAGSTLKMQLAENCLTDDGMRIRKGTPVFGEVTQVDGERVLVKITSVNLGGNILPFRKEVYSEDAMPGIYVPGNVKAETVKEAEAAGIGGANASISGGLDMGSQIVAGAANSVINATKSAASKNIRKVKVTIKTNYRILLRQAER